MTPFPRSLCPGQESDYADAVENPRLITTLSPGITTDEGTKFECKMTNRDDVPKEIRVEVRGCKSVYGTSGPMCGCNLYLLARQEIKLTVTITNRATDRPTD